MLLLISAPLPGADGGWVPEAKRRAAVGRMQAEDTGSVILPKGNWGDKFTY